ncbi:hypothetical protein [Microbacterium aurantiacum]|uniref:hypothetical protein n=1 Tax=Microbacterium aurantiacum TaxID=162393 RepID=UPI00342EB246
MTEYMVQFRNYWSEKNGDVRPDGTMSLNEAQRYVAEHPETEYVILHRTGGAEPSLWTPVAPDDAPEGKGRCALGN